ncbi:hypothetical protein [Nonomuraea sp. NEAU-A123]|uniref:hypothetical protein n=1 Tax=Nonomuraea sp. NEAU-A123 TaxID=2839649 RepID=UPI001BE49C08|nr:hypothetical protein [Nonomuraea sp. NEAU-A123]MBT2235507.1 hypothetical protein [Nonomuraea sp. NEAU-A123]
MSDADEAAFIGVGELPSGRYPHRPFMGSLVEVAVAAVRDAGVPMADIDTILLIPCLHSPADQADLVFSRVVEELGLAGRAKASYMIHSGGSMSNSYWAVSALHDGPDLAEGVEAFLERRPSRFNRG